jgi:hypothetical protein
MDLLEKLTMILSKKGVDEEIIKESLAELGEGEEPKPTEADPAEEEKPVEKKETQAEAQQGEEPEDKPTEKDAPAPTEAPAEDVVPVEEANKAIEGAVQEATAEKEAENEELKAHLDELSKTIEAVLKRCESLEEALKKAGVLDGDPKDFYGVDKATAPSRDGDESDLGSFLAEVNSRR